MVKSNKHLPFVLHRDLGLLHPDSRALKWQISKRTRVDITNPSSILLPPDTPLSSLCYPFIYLSRCVAAF